jgi:SAM-dependent methyltransferase
MAEHSITNSVQSFYEDLPFNYDETGLLARNRIRMNPVLSYPDLHKLLKSGNIRSVLEVGCGVGWMSAALAMHYGMTVDAIDLTPRAVERAQLTMRELKLDNLVKVRQCDVFNFDPNEKKYDLVISIGVLHHTKDCEGAFKHIVKAINEDGSIFIGLYHKYAREIMLNYYWDIVRSQGEEWAFREYKHAHKELGEETLAKSWFKDQILHPHETLHTLKESRDWVEEVGLQIFATSINECNEISDWDELLHRETEYARLSYVRNVLQRKFFPGFYTFLASKSGKVDKVLFAEERLPWSERLLSWVRGEV